MCCCHGKRRRRRRRKMMLHMKKESSMMKHHREKKIAVDGELTCIGRNCMTCHMHLVEKLQDPLVKFICAWHRFVTKKSFEETVQLGESESGELKRCLRLCELFFLVSCLMSMQLPDAIKSLQEHERSSSRAALRSFLCSNHHRTLS